VASSARLLVMKLAIGGREHPAGVARDGGLEGDAGFAIDCSRRAVAGRRIRECRAWFSSLGGSMADDTLGCDTGGGIQRSTLAKPPSLITAPPCERKEVGFVQTEADISSDGI